MENPLRMSFCFGQLFVPPMQEGKDRYLKEEELVPSNSNYLQTEYLN